MSRSVIAAYYDAFNRGDLDAMAETLHSDFVHHVNEGRARIGKAAFADFCRHMSETYRETLTEMVIFANADSTRAAAEFTVQGTYVKTDPGLPEAHGQTYTLPAGAFFSLKDGRITRVTTYYNLQDWIEQVSA